MTLEQLRIFVAVAEREHVTKAARELNLTQSAVSSAIAALEARHGVVLFDRVGRGIELTQAGRIFLDEARAVLSRAAAAECTLADISGLERGTISIHASQTIASYWLPAKLVEFRKAHPRISISLRAANTAQAARAVADGSADIGFVEGPVEGVELTHQILAKDRLVIVVAHSHPWGAGKELEVFDLCSSDWVLREPGSGTRAEFEEALQNQGYSISQLNVVLEVPSNEAARIAVEEGAGATVISELSAAPGLRSNRLKIAAFDLPERHFEALCHRERYLSKAAAALLAFLAPNDDEI